MDSSSYTISAGQSVTFTVRIMANGGPATGTVAFKANGSIIGGCAAIAVSNAVATCTTSSFTAGSYAITGVYSGDANNSSGIAGPITQTVK